MGDSSIHNYKKVTKRWLEMISAIGNANSKLVVEFINALRIYGVGEGKVKYYAQYSYSIL